EIFSLTGGHAAGRLAAPVCVVIADNRSANSRGAAGFRGHLRERTPDIDVPFLALNRLRKEKLSAQSVYESAVLQAIDAARTFAGENGLWITECQGRKSGLSRGAKTLRETHRVLRCTGNGSG